MKAICYHRYGSPDVMGLEEIRRPVNDEDGVLVRVAAASVNPLDWHFMRGQPYVMRLMFGLRRPKSSRPGVDVSGRVEAVGANVTQFRPGDEVFGGCGGAFAEYVSGAEKCFVPKPAGLTFEQAAAIPVAGCTALQALRDHGHLQPGQKVLINGAAGGVGTFAVQIAKALGADVTGVCGTRNLDLVRSIGADQVVDYTAQDFTRRGQKYDLIVDAVGNRSLLDLRRTMTPRGTLLLLGGGSNRLLGPLVQSLRARILFRFGGQRTLMFFAQVNKDDLLVLKELVETGKVVPVIDRTFPLSQTPEAIRLLETGHARGKVVVTSSWN
jgi:NADPH:quinone reductase-like Zn-dependent oxidoreductase